MDASCETVIANTKYNKKYNGHIAYGTAGFRTNANNLEHVLYRMGTLAVLRSKFQNAAIGLMITASHNVESDNGVKLVDPAGEMLEASWESIATDLANVEDINLTTMINQIIEKQNIDMSFAAVVITGRDTRKSSPALLNAALAGINALNGTICDFGIVTTPQLHYFVVCTNTGGSYGDATLSGYYTKISTAFKLVRGTSNDNGKYVAELQLDAANGVGAIAAKEFQKYLSDSLIIHVSNDGDGVLNYGCGADYVKMQQLPPSNMSLKANARCVSLDGDADRIVYFYIDESNKFYLLDGDRIATLVAGFLKELLQTSNLSLQLGLVQTAYANGGSTDYISNILNVPVACASTGVKHLHSKAAEFDIGIYFEANGHGTITFKDTAMKLIRTAVENSELPEHERAAACKLANVIDIINQTVGDALSDMLLVETILHAKGWDIVQWEQSYEDLPNKQVKVKVHDRSVITTTNAERQCVTPKGLQDEIDKVVSHYSQGRSFVRPSGTEDIVRVYAECKNSSDVERLAGEISLLVHRMAGGVGPAPTLS